METLPSGANFKRAALLWEAALHIAGNPETPYGGNRDVCVTVGSGSAESFTPWLRMATGSAVLAHAVAKGDLEMAFINPSGLLTQAYRGTGLFTEKLPIRVVASYPSWDRFVCAFDPGLGISSFAEIKDRRLPIRLSIREDSTHSTRVLIDQMLAEMGFSLDDLVSWGGSLHLVGGPGDKRRLNDIASHGADAIFDEGIGTWLPAALVAGYRPITPDAPALARLQEMGWRKAVLPVGRFPALPGDQICIDFSGWPLYTRESLPDDVAYDVCEALRARSAWIPWDERDFTGVESIGFDAEVTPLDIPLHPGAARWYREHGANV